MANYPFYSTTAASERTRRTSDLKSNPHSIKINLYIANFKEISKIIQTFS